MIKVSCYVRDGVSYEPQHLYGIAGPLFTAMSGLIISVEDRYRAAAFYPPLIHSGFLMDITRRCGIKQKNNQTVVLFFLPQ